MNRKNLLMVLVLISCSIHAMAQDYFYYYQGKKIPLTLNESKVIVSIPKEYDETIERVRANVQVLSTIRDKTFDIIIIHQSDLEKLTSLDFWEEDKKSVILTSSYYTEENAEVYATPYLTVRLRKEEDIDLLTSYAETYRINIVGNSRYMPLWYTLNVTSESEKSPLEIANELYESGDFAEAAADLASHGSDYDAVRSITTSKTGASSRIYDLQGHRIAKGQPLQPGIYVKDGRKVVVK